MLCFEDVRVKGQLEIIRSGRIIESFNPEIGKKCIDSSTLVVSCKCNR